LARCLALFVLLAAMAFHAGATSVESAPQRQATFTILAIGFVDLFGGNDPDCPGCNLEYDPEDEEAAMTDPLPEMEFRVLDTDGNEIARDVTTPLAGLQRVSFEVPELADGEQYTLELVTPPVGWELCPNEAASRVLVLDDFQLATTRADYHFWHGCDLGEPTSTPTTPGGPTATPTKPPEDEDEEEEDGEPQQLGSIKGLAFIDLEGDGILGPNDPGLNDVGVHLVGGGLQLFQVTGSTGQFSFDGLGAGEYDVFVQPGPEWRVTTPSRYKVKVSGNVVTGIDFGFVRVGAAPPKKIKRVAPGAGVRLPSTGFTDLPMSRLMGVVALILAALTVVGFSTERFKQRR
jgi:hypothetical protein